MSSFEISSKMFHVRFYSEKSKDRYSSSFQLFVDGNTGIIYGLNGSDFFKNISKHILGIMHLTGIDRVLFTMMRDTYDQLEKRIKDQVDLSVVREVKAHGRDMVEIELRLR